VRKSASTRTGWKRLKFPQPCVPARRKPASRRSTRPFQRRRRFGRRAGGPAPSGRRGLQGHQPLFAPGHLEQLRKILDDPEATENDKFVAFDLLKNANIAAGMACCRCARTPARRSSWARRAAACGPRRRRGIAREGARDAYFKKNLRYSQLAPISMFEEKNTKNNMPAQIEIYSEGEDAYKFLFMAKGGGSANKTFLYPGNAVAADARPA
jgi:hypothetical protein